MIVTEKASFCNISEMLLQDVGQSDNDINLGQNPALPGIIGSYMDWPVMTLFFEAEGMPVAWFAALWTGKSWFSLPHFNNGAWWFSGQNLTSWFDQNGISASEFSQSDFFEKFVINNSIIRNKPILNQFFRISIEANDFREKFEPLKAPSRILVRSYQPLTPHRLAHKSDSIVQLKKTVEAQWDSLDTNVRRKINKASLNELTVKTGVEELLDDFYSVYRRNIHALGSVGLPKEFFGHILKKYINGKVLLFVAYHNGIPVGSACWMQFLRFSENPWFSTLRSYNHLYVSYLLHWEMIKTAIGEGCRLYSLGHSTTGSSVHIYKQQWSTTDRTIFVNSTHPVNDHLKAKQYLRKIIRKIPQEFMMKFDGVVSRKIF